MPRRSNTHDFVQKSVAVHGDRFDYSKVVYLNNDSKVIIICKDHGEFLQTPSGYLSGYDGCPACRHVKNSSDLVTFVEKAKLVHGDKYGYSEVIYINNKVKVKVFCKEHLSFFFQSPSNHLNGNGHGCPFCFRERIAKSRTYYSAVKK